MVKEIRLSGFGGQGIILIGVLLAEAAGIHDGKEVVHAQSYGGEVRGGAVRSDVVIGEEDDEIDYPAVSNPDILLAMSQEAADKYAGSAKNNGIILFDSTYVLTEPASNAKIFYAPLTSTAQEKLGTRLCANLIALGTICQLTNIVSEKALKRAVLEGVPKGTEEINMKALQEGLDIAEKLKKGTKFS